MITLLAIRVVSVTTHPTTISLMTSGCSAVPVRNGNMNHAWKLMVSWVITISFANVVLNMFPFVHVNLINWIFSCQLGHY